MQLHEYCCSASFPAVWVILGSGMLRTDSERWKREGGTSATSTCGNLLSPVQRARNTLEAHTRWMRYDMTDITRASYLHKRGRYTMRKDPKEVGILSALVLAYTTQVFSRACWALDCHSSHSTYRIQSGKPKCILALDAPVPSSLTA